MIAWHYTIGKHLDSILGMGMLLPASIGVEPPERPVVWFSLDQTWERTAAKAMVDTRGRMHRLSMHETALHCGGIYRLGIDAKALNVGEALRKAARISSTVWRQLCAEGIRQGASPSNWCGAVGAISVDDLCIERLESVGATWTALEAIAA